MKRSSYWQYFLAIESDLEATVRFVEPSHRNFNTYSIEFAKVLLTASSEVDVICKLLARDIDSTLRSDNIGEHRTVIIEKYPHFPEMQILVPRYELKFEPWLPWATGLNPEWWQSYNAVKHERHTSFPMANQNNAFQSVAGLFCLLAYLYHEDIIREALNPWPKLIDIEADPTALFPEDRYRLPDFTRYSSFKNNADDGTSMDSTSSSSAA